MSKVEELRAKFPRITSKTFNIFADGDITPTKKYLLYFLKMWENKSQNGVPPTSTKLVKKILEFDQLLPYLDNKDIYSKIYSNYHTLCEYVEKAQNLKEEKTFTKEGNVNILEETDQYIFLNPLTHIGSCKYGAQTKWCTASKNNPQTFKDYSKNGFLAYLIDKTNNVKDNFKKVAFYIHKTNSSSQSEFDIYNTVDNSSDMRQILKAGWDEDTIFLLTLKFRMYYHNWRKATLAKDSIDNLVLIINTINLDDIKKNLQIIETSKDYDYISKAKEAINNLTEKLKQI